MLSNLEKNEKVVGTKQVKRAILSGNVQVVFIAKDAEEKVVGDLKILCNKKSIEIVYVDTMKELGKACGIDISAASAALLNKK
jgi:large subunit ribosomal protein L7A